MRACVEERAESLARVVDGLDCREEGYDTRLVFVRLCATAIIRVDSVFVFEPF